MPRKPLARRLLGALRRELRPAPTQSPAAVPPERPQPAGDPREVATLRRALRRELERLAARESDRGEGGARHGQSVAAPAEDPR